MKKTHIFLAIVMCLLYAAAMWGLFSIDPPAGSKEPILVLIGGLSGALGAIVQYYFGSSLGSAEKNALIGKKDPP